MPRRPRENGYEPGPENFGYLVRIHVQDTDEKAYDVGKGYMVGNIGVGRIPLPRDYASPVGYGSRSDDPALPAPARADPQRPLPRGRAGLERSTTPILDSKRWIIGSPDTVISQLREVLSFMRPGILAVWTNDGSISHEDTMRCLELMGQEVLPALREIGEELELTDPFQKEGVQARADRPVTAAPFNRSYFQQGARTPMANFTEETISVAGGNLQVYKGGSGDPLLVLHGAGGNAGPRRYAQALAEKFTVYLPSHPGYGKSDRPGWVETMQDLACFYTWYQEQEGLENVRAIGFSMGRLAGGGNCCR